MKNLVAVIAAGMAMFLAAEPASAHHSFAVTYFEDQNVKIEGMVVEFVFRNPHSFLTVDAPDPKTNQTLRWTIEWASSKRLGNEGVNAATLKPGDPVSIVGHPGRVSEEHRLHMREIVRPDGWKWGHPTD